jgi:hypothetical protein
LPTYIGVSNRSSVQELQWSGVTKEGPDPTRRSRRKRQAGDRLPGRIHQGYDPLPKLVETIGDALDGEGKYLVYVADIPLGCRWYMPIGAAKIFVVSIDETSVYNELIDIFYVDKVKLKKYDTSAKLDALADVGLKYSSVSDYQAISYEEGLERRSAA